MKMIITEMEFKFQRKIFELEFESVLVRHHFDETCFVMLY